MHENEHRERGKTEVLNTETSGEQKLRDKYKTGASVESYLNSMEHKIEMRKRGSTVINKTKTSHTHETHERQPEKPDLGDSSL